MDTPDISLTSFSLSSMLECVFSQQQMLNRQEQMHPLGTSPFSPVSQISAGHLHAAVSEFFYYFLSP